MIFQIVQIPFAQKFLLCIGRLTKSLFQPSCLSFLVSLPTLQRIITLLVPETLLARHSLPSPLVMCAITPKNDPRSGYFLVLSKCIYVHCSAPRRGQGIKTKDEWWQLPAPLDITPCVPYDQRKREACHTMRKWGHT